MKTKNLKSGDRLIFGSPKELKEGRSGKEVFFITAGKYTATYGPCGEAVMPYRGTHAETRIVIAEEIKRGPDLVWRPRLTTGRSLMDPAEYKVKAGVIEKQRRALVAHQTRRTKLEVAISKVCADTLTELLGMEVLPSDVGFTYDQTADRRQRWVSDVPYFTTKQRGHLLENVVFTKRPEIRELLADLKRWHDEPGPDTCQL